MKTVTTLCATGTIGAAAVGLTFGHPSDTLPRSSLPTQSEPLRDAPTETSRASSAQGRPPSTPQSFTQAHPLSHESEGITAQRPRREEPPSSFRMRPRTSDLKRRASQELSSPRESPTPSRHLPRQFSSTNFSHDSGSLSSEQPISRSATYSSASATPFITPPSAPSSLPPNKLVKRSLSQQLPSTSSTGSSLGVKITLRRPNTSRQRSATLSQQSAEAEGSTLDPQAPWRTATKEQGPITYRHCFRANVYQSNQRVSSRRRSTGEATGIKCIRPLGLCPSLLFARSLVTGDVRSDDMLTEYLDDTPVPQNRKTSSEPLKTYSSSPIAVATPGNGPVENSPRRSFSFSDLLRRRTSPASTLSQSSSKLRRRPGQRIPSAPTLAMSSGKPQNSINVSPLEGRRAAPNVLSDARASGQNSSPMDQSPTEMRHSKYRRTRQSPTSSDATVSHRGSDYGTRVFSYTDDDDADFASDTVYDSVRTGTTRSTSGARQLGLETLFDRSSSSINRGNEQSSASNEGTSNYASAPSTPKTSQLRGSNGSDHSRTPLAQDHNNITLDSGSVERVKAPEITSALNQSSEPSPSEDEFWDNDDDDLQDYHHNRWPMFDLHADPSEAQDRQNIATPENESRPNLFDWSEQQPVDRSSTDATPPRPKTVHGKKYPDFRGNLSTGRRAPSGLHARSHSVPVLPDLASKRTHAAPKFGTWGIGSKGVTEDWNEDFDFAEEEELENKTDASQQAKSEIKPTILVPESIQKHQTNVLANIGLLREWGLLIEELKDLRMRATSGGLVIDEHDKVFDEVDAMIDLADQEVEDEVPLQSSSPYAEAGLKDIDLDNYLSSVNGTPRGSTNTPHAEIWASGLPSTVPYTESPLNSQKDSPPSIARPRKDSEAVAKSVVEACQQRSIPEGKVPFDTATLRHIVPYVNNLMRKVKQVLREAEGLNTSPEGKWKPALSQAFVEPESPSMSRQQRLKDSMGPLGRSDGQIDDDDVLGHLKLMKLT